MPYISTYDKFGNLLERNEIIISLGLYKNQKTDGIRYSCSYAIQSAGLDESTQQNAALGIYPPERCEAIKSYIAACRNEYLRCKELILAAQTNDEADAVQFVAPPVPSGL
jgi:hypothetical protein